MARNRLVHYGVRKTVNELVGFIFGYLHEIEEISPVRVITVHSATDLEIPPDPGFIKINFDSSYNAKTHSAISGILAQNHLGQIMEACTYPVDHVAYAFIAEAWAWEQAVRFAIDMGFRKVQMEGDSLTVIKRLNSYIKNKSVLSPIVGHIKDYLSFFYNITLLHIRRNANCAAHSLAKEGRRFQSARFWVEEATVEKIVEMD